MGGGQGQDKDKIRTLCGIHVNLGRGINMRYSPLISINLDRSTKTFDVELTLESGLRALIPLGQEAEWTADQVEDTLQGLVLTQARLERSEDGKK